MQLKNTETGVHRILRETKMRAGMSEADAVAWATENLKTGIERFKATFRQHERDPEVGLEAAYANLITWAQE